ncbi:SDR family oxidoreductase [Oceanobacillus halotolerans]|uniref:SDR family oxidoreductase n=1 Tax=Oceanobacillus halotolerans TaxID=2663380 RepID=UPI0013DA8122|nr:SDR family oxidoreductase [Oceanobacillus halotolerans]
MMDLNGITAIVTGASSGIGESVAKRLASQGANVLLAARRKERLSEVVTAIQSDGKGQALAAETDVTDRDSVESMVAKAVKEFGPVDILVNNAGAVLSSTIKDGEVKNWDQMIDVNIKGVLYGINAVLPGMLDRSVGHIVNIASVSGLEAAKKGTVYSATKFAVRAISMGLEKELARTGIRVTNISPGQVDTAILTNSPKDRKPLQPEDIARAVVYSVTQPDYVNVNEVTVRPV